MSQCMDPWCKDSPTHSEYTHGYLDGMSIALAHLSIETERLAHLEYIRTLFDEQNKFVYGKADGEAE